MNLRADQITRLQQELRELLSLSESMHPTDSASTERPAATPAVAETPERVALLQRLAATDENLYEDLQRLQRTLSRQSFRGAESARRLVRRLSKRASENAQAARSAIPSGHPAVAVTRHQVSPHESPDRLSAP